MDREDEKGYVEINHASNHVNDFDIFYQFMDYMDDETKQGELFTANQDYLNDSEKQKMKNKFQLAQQNESPMWQDVISFDNDWLEKQGVYNSENHTVDETKMRSIVRETKRTMMKAKRIQ